LLLLVEERVACPLFSTEDQQRAVFLVLSLKTAGKPTRSSTSSSNVAKKDTSDSSFSVAVSDVYEGPLDLLLDLIRKQDIDIYDIPIARITAQYLTYVERMRELDVNVAADFIYMARS